MSALLRLVFVATTLSMTACTSLSEQELDYPEQRVDVEFKPEFPLEMRLQYPEEFKTGEMLLQSLDQYAEQYKKAKQESTAEGGKWVLTMHSHSSANDRWTYKCKDREQLAMSDADKNLKQKDLLPYNLAIDFIRKSQRVVNFTRVHPSTDQDQPDKKEKNSGLR